jgi:kinesin family protein 2/24
MPARRSRSQSPAAAAPAAGSSIETGGDAAPAAAVPVPQVQRIVVAVRKRPKLGASEANEADVLDAMPDRNIVEVREPKISIDGRKVTEQRGSYSFDHVFDERSSNARIYVQAVRPVLDVTRKGGSAVFFAYGQTGSGKTHTMMGSADGSEHGLYALAARDIIAQLRGMRLFVSFYEIYSGKLFDLLNGRSPVQTLEDEHKFLHLVGITEHPVSDHQALLDLMNRGAAHRSSGSTHVNERSSRSHAVLVFTVKPRRQPLIFARMSFIDLAGSERAADTLDLDKKTRAEGAEINRSLLALKECVRAMHERKRHIPFRGSKLTQVLRDSFQGNCVTVMIAAVSPCMMHCDDTVNTLKYTDRIKEMHTSAQQLSDAVANQSVEPDLCSKCGFPILLDEKSLHVCPKEYVPCKYCKMEIVKAKMQRHQQECLEVPMSCPDCGLRATRGQLYAHADKCPSAHFTCPLCAQRVPRRQRDTHAVTDCPEAKRPCPYCKAAVKRKEHVDHVGLCPQRPIPCSSCGMSVKQGVMRDHTRQCFAGTRNRATPGLMTPSRLPPIRRDSTATNLALTIGGQSNRPSSASTGRTPKNAEAGAASPLTARVKPAKPKPKKPTPKKPAAAPMTPDPEALTPPPSARERPVVKATPAKRKASSSKIKPKPKASPAAKVPGPPVPADAPVQAVPASAGPSAPSPPPGAPSAASRGGTAGGRSGARQLSPSALAEPAAPPAVQAAAEPRHSEAEPEVACPFADAGCTATMPQSAIDAHVASNVASHLMLVHSHSMRVQRENEHLRDKLHAVERQVHESSGPPTKRVTPARLFEAPKAPLTPPARHEGTLACLDEKQMSGRRGKPAAVKPRR